MSDNFHFDLTGVPLDLCMQVATSQHNRGAIGYRIQTEPSTDYRAREWKPATPAGRMVLYWAEPESGVQINLFPAKLAADDLVPLIKAWLSEQDYGRQPDHDGSNGKGWRVYNEGWTHVNGEWQAFAAIEPAWLEYGK